MTNVNIYESNAQDQLFLTESHHGRGLVMDNFSLIEAIDNFIMEGKKSYYDLSKSDKHILLALYMDGFSYESITEADGLDTTLNKLRKFLFCGSIKNACSLANTMRENVEKYLTDSVALFYDERVSIIDVELKREAGLRPYQHADNGETTWMRA